MSYWEARELLKKASRGIKQRPWEVLNASITIKKSRELVQCPTCSIGRVRRFQAEEGQSCQTCVIQK